MNEFDELVEEIFAEERQREQEQDVAVDETPEEALISYAWTIIANAGEGDWERERPEWKEAAERWRDQYHAWLATREGSRA